MNISQKLKSKILREIKFGKKFQAIDVFFIIFEFKIPALIFQHQKFIFEFFFAFSSEIHFELNIIIYREKKFN